MGFADDCCALVGGTNIRYMVQKLKRILNKLVAWGETAGLKFNEQKQLSSTSQNLDLNQNTL